MKMIQCKKCDGNGCVYDDQDELVECPVCKGKGRSPEEKGWLVEWSGVVTEKVRGPIGWLYLKPMFNGFGALDFGVIHDSNKALRLCRKEDAEAVLKLYLGAGKKPEWYTDPWSVTEHIWVDSAMTTPPAEPNGINLTQVTGLLSLKLAEIESLTTELAAAKAEPLSRAFVALGEDYLKVKAELAAAKGPLEGLEFTPGKDGDFELADMANIGYRLMKVLPDDYSWSESPSEIVNHLTGKLEVAAIELAAAKRDAERWQLFVSGDYYFDIDTNDGENFFYVLCLDEPDRGEQVVGKGDTKNEAIDAAQQPTEPNT